MVIKKIRIVLFQLVFHQDLCCLLDMPEISVILHVEHRKSAPKTKRLMF